MNILLYIIRVILALGIGWASLWPMLGMATLTLLAPSWVKKVSGVEILFGMLFLKVPFDLQKKHQFYCFPIQERFL